MAKRIEEVKRSSPEPWRAAETVWEITEDYQMTSDMPPLGMVLFTILTEGQHPYGLTGRKESVVPAMKVLCISTKFRYFSKIFFPRWKKYWKKSRQSRFE